MKIKHLIPMMGLLFMTATGFAQKEELTLKSSIVCEMCKETIEEGLAYTKGVKSARVDVAQNEIHVVYKPKKISESELKDAINELGYVAGDSKPTREQYDRLHHCCKAEGACE